MKTCSKCLKSKPTSEFYKRSGRQVNNLASYCKPCHKKKAAEARARFLVRNPDYARKYHLERNYGISLEQYQEMVDSQGGLCAICSQESELFVDHDHSCCIGSKTCGSCIRGLICDKCNRGVGLLQDSPEILESALKYLTSSKVAP